jgi:hypothetical protein
VMLGSLTTGPGYLRWARGLGRRAEARGSLAWTLDALARVGGWTRECPASQAGVLTAREPPASQQGTDGL